MCCSPHLLEEWVCGMAPYRVYINYCVCVLEMSQETGLNSDDIVSTLQFYSMLKYWKGKHIVLKRKASL